jgi:hypothetical protein
MLGKEATKILETKNEAFKSGITNIIEKKFRDSRKVIIPFEQQENMEVPLKRKRLGDIDLLRYVLKNWHKTASAIVNKNYNAHAINSCRYKVRQYLKGNKDRCPKSYHALIEEYKEYLEQIDEQKQTNVLLEPFEYLLNFWNDTGIIKDTFNLEHTTIAKWKWSIKEYLKGSKKHKLSPDMVQLVEKYKNNVVKAINYTEPEEAKKNREFSKIKTQQEQDKKFETVLRNWNDFYCEENLALYAKSTLGCFRHDICKYFKTGKYNNTVSPHRAKFVEKHRDFLLGYTKTFQETRAVSKFYASEAVQKVVSRNPELLEKQDTLTSTSETKENDNFIVKFIDYLKKQGIKEITLKF